MRIAGVLCIVVLSACGGGGDETPDARRTADAPATVDAPPMPPDGPSGPCDPLAPAGQQNCAAGQKCTWVVITEEIGEVACVPAGTVELGGACMFGPNGETTGYDDCVAGAVCVGSTCRDVCGFDGSANAACATGSSCTRYAGLFANGADDAVAGACNPTCDPLTQTIQTPTGPTDCGVGLGCYTLSNATDTIAVCASAPSTPVTHNQPIVGPVFANSCSPGHAPRLAVQGGTSFECGAFCKPADVYMGMNDGAGGQPDYEGGNSSVMNWMNLPATCESAGGATVAPDVPVTGETCMYFWTREATDNLTAFSNTLGWCFNFASFQYDTGSGMAPYPRCVDLVLGDVLPPIDGTPDPLYFGCTALPATVTSPLAPQRVQLDRIGGFR